MIILFTLAEIENSEIMMLVFVIGYIFYRLANKFNKSPWLWALIGSVIYFIINFSLSLIALILEIRDETAVKIGCTVLSAIIVYFIYRYFMKKWANEKSTPIYTQIDEIGKNPESFNLQNDKIKK